MPEEVITTFEIDEEIEENDCGIMIQLHHDHSYADLDFVRAKEGKYKLVKEE